MTNSKKVLLKIAEIAVIVAIILILASVLRNIIIKINYPQKYSKYVVRKDIFDNDFKGFDNF